MGNEREEETKTILELQDVTTVYGLHEMLRKVNVKIQRAQIICLLGPNGAGKTTLIKSILGLVKITGGSILFRGQDITGNKTYTIVRGGIATVPEGRRIFPKMTVLENLRMGAFARRERAVFETGLEQVLDLFPALKDRLSQVAGTLSGGEQSMVSIGRGLMSNPDLMLLDEPSLGLAPILVKQLFETIHRINRAGKAVLLAEQNAAQALKVASYGYVIQRGEIVAQGSRDELVQLEMVRSAYLIS